MKLVLLVTMLCLQVNGITYNFFRDVKPEYYEDTRRIFGGTTAPIKDFPRSCLLTDKFKTPTCTGSIITPLFVITAGHCIVPRLRFIFFNSRTPLRGQYTYIFRVYRHPGFHFVTVNEGQGPDVVQLYHDIGLVESRQDIILAFPAAVQVKNHLQTLRTNEVLSKDVDVLGFGSNDAVGNSELLLIKLTVRPCFRSTWQHCACGVTRIGENPRGTCFGDSGGPVLHNGTLVGVISMGPSACSSKRKPFIIYTTVFTMVANYADMIDRTINHKENGMMEIRLSNADTLSSLISKLYISKYVSFWLVSLILLKIMN